jgi:autotransporter family porin
VTVSGTVVAGKYYSSRSSADSTAHGIYLSNIGSATVTMSGTGSITTYGGEAHGIYILNSAGDVSVTADVAIGILTYGSYAHGIAIADTGSATDSHNVTLDIAGSVSASGIDADAVKVSETYGAVQIALSGAVTGGGGFGAGIALDNPSATSSAITIGNTGALGALSDIAIRALDPVTISNAGTITGYLSLGDGDDRFTNTGTWYLRHYADTDGDGVRDRIDTASTDFGLGENQLLNSGTLSLLKGTSSQWQGELVNLDTFRNSGVIDLQDRIVGDWLSISGDFQSDGGSLLLDVVLDDGSSSPQADVLYLDQVSLLTSATKISVSNAGGLGGQTSGNRILLVDAQDDDSGGAAFTLSKRVIAGAYEYELSYDAGASDWYLRSGIFSGTEEYPALMTAALLSFGSDWSALHNRLSDGRFDEQDLKIEPAGWLGSTARPRPWLQVNHARQEIAADAAFDQEVVKFEAGADLPFVLGNGGTALIGVFLGLGRNKQELNGSTTEVESDVALGGLYASYRSGGFYANAIAKYEHHQARVKNAATDDNGSSFDIDLWGGSLESGYRFALKSAYVQPRLRLNSVHAASTSFQDASSTSIALESADSVAGEAAARLGFLLDSGEIYLDGGARHEFLGETEASASGLSFSDALPGTAGFIAGGLALQLAEGKVLVALEGGYAKGSEGEDVTASAALTVVY